MSDTKEAAAVNPARGKRVRWLAAVIGVFLLAGVGYGVYWMTVLRYRQTTDDAYVSGNVVQITPQISGTVVSIGADDTQFVKAGQTLVQLDPADARIALEQAEAKLGKTVREVRGFFATTEQLRAALEVRNTEVARASEDLARRERLASAGAVSGEELQHARTALASAKAAQAAAQQELAANRARVDRTTIANHPDVQAAAAAVHDAYLDVSRTQLPAPVSGFVAKRAVQLGQRVSPGAPLMAIVPLDQVWVDANFKEPQLAAMRVGQPATLKADLYGGKVEYHGTVIGFGAGTGSAFALLPAQNATGNWIKIVQRVPVRIALDAQELAAHPLQVGLSMEVEVDTHRRDGERLPQVTQNTPAYSTNVYDTVDSAANRRVNEIIAANSAGAAAASAVASSRPPVVAAGKARLTRTSELRPL
ncbi:MAG TPA: efflux RND transporter periplasmic adaptor subunit [Casimicrobiaceae bacterium]|jgi:membrane fusion protein, multidrug efflux system|nr:efflux RND transporter periplasmic adaptor subunit [Casimicrobiaceae bacterium]